MPARPGGPGQVPGPGGGRSRAKEDDGILPQGNVACSSTHPNPQAAVRPQRRISGWAEGGGWSTQPGSGCGPPPGLALNSFSPGRRGRGKRNISMFSLPTTVSHLFRGHQVLGDSAPELPPDLAQQNTLADPSSQICLSVRTQPPNREGGPKHSPQSTSLGSQQTPTKEDQVRIYPQKKVLTSHT